MKVLVTLALVATLIASVPAAVYLAPHLKAQISAFGEVRSHLQQEMSIALRAFRSALSITAHGGHSLAAGVDTRHVSPGEPPKAQTGVQAEGTIRHRSEHAVQLREESQSQARVQVAGQGAGTLQLGTGHSETHVDAENQGTFRLTFDLSGLKGLLFGRSQGEVEVGTR